MFTAKDAEEETDALFSVKKINCASCTKDLGKYEGKLGQFRPWAIFPCKQMDPEKTGGYGFLNYLEKMSHKRGNSTDDMNLERFTKTFYESKNNVTPSNLNQN